MVCAEIRDHSIFLIVLESYHVIKYIYIPYLTLNLYIPNQYQHLSSYSFVQLLVCFYAILPPNL